MARRVFLHVGTMKSATSYLQELCNVNVGALAAAGVLWTWSADNFLAVDDLLGTNRERPHLDGAWEAMATRLRAHEGDALISDELLAGSAPPRIGRLVEALAPAEVHVVVTARDLGRTIPSQWQTGVRNGHTVPYADYVDALTTEADDELTRRFWRRHDVADIIRRFSRKVPLERISVVTVPPPGADPSVTGERFAAVIGVDPAVLVQPPSSNASLGAHSAELLRRLNTRVGHLDALHYKWAYKNALSRLVLTARAADEPTLELTPAQRAWARDRARRLVTAVASTGVRVVGELDDLVPAEPAEPSSEGTGDGAQVSDGELLEAALDALRGLGEVLAGLRIEHEELVDVAEATLDPADRRQLQATLVAGYREASRDPAESLLARSRLLRSALVSHVRPGEG